MNFGFGNLLALFRGGTAAPTAEQMSQQAQIGGGLEVVRDKIVRDERRKKAAHLTGQKARKEVMLAKAGVTKPAATKRG